MKPEEYDEDKATDRIFLHQENPEEQLAKNPSWMNYYGSQAAKWAAKAEYAKIDAKDRRGNLAKELKDSGAKLTATDITAYQDSDPEYVRLIKQHHKYAMQAALYSNAHYSLDKKQFSLQVIKKRDAREEQVTKSISYNPSEETYEEKKARILAAQD